MTSGGPSGLELGPRVVPSPMATSDLLREAIEATSVAERAAELEFVPADEADWLDFLSERDSQGAAEVMAAVEQLPVSVEADEVAGVEVFHVTPDAVDAARLPQRVWRLLEV